MVICVMTNQNLIVANCFEPHLSGSKLNCDLEMSYLKTSFCVFKVFEC